MVVKMKSQRKIWKCDCGNQEQTRIITALDGEVVCGVCGTVLGQVNTELEEPQDQPETWNGETDLCRKILEDRVSKKGWEF